MAGMDPGTNHSAATLRSLAGGGFLPGRGLLKLLRQLTAQICDQLAQGGDGARCLGVRRRALARVMAAAGLQYLLAARRENAPPCDQQPVACDLDKKNRSSFFRAVSRAGICSGLFMVHSEVAWFGVISN